MTNPRCATIGGCRRSPCGWCLNALRQRESLPGPFYRVVGSAQKITTRTVWAAWQLHLRSCCAPGYLCHLSFHLFLISPRVRFESVGDPSQHNPACAPPSLPSPTTAPPLISNCRERRWCLFFIAREPGRVPTSHFTFCHRWTKTLFCRL